MKIWDLANCSVLREFWFTQVPVLRGSSSYAQFFKMKIQIFMPKFYGSTNKYEKKTKKNYGNE